MALYLKQIQQLAVLQKVDDEIIDIEADMERAPREVAEAEAAAEALGEKTTQVKEKIDLLKKQRSRLESEIEEDSNKVKKSKNKLMMVGNTREYHAMMREMDSLEKLNRMREEEKVALIEELGNQEAVLTELNTELGELEADLAQKRAGLEAALAEGKKRLTSLNKQRATSCKAVPGPILGRYEFIRSRLQNPVIVPVEEGVCCGCNIKIPPQTYNDLQKGQQIISCPNCQRLIFWGEHVAEEDKGKEESKAKEKSAA